MIETPRTAKSTTGYEIRLTEFTHSGGCGGKISSSDLEVLLQSRLKLIHSFEALLVGNDTRDDAAIFDLGGGTCVVSSTDFSMPIVDDPFDFGRIAATNALSDVYAMGGKPLMAIAVFGWPTKLLPLEVGRSVLEGGRQACRDAGITLAGGHSIDTAEPIFGLAVTGVVKTEHIKRNSTAQVGNNIFLTKPLGIGILTTAQKHKVLEEQHQDLAVESMCRLNRLGTGLGRIEAVAAMTDVTGFGLAGHLIEVCEASGVRAIVDFDNIPTLPALREYLQLIPASKVTEENMASAGTKISTATAFQRQIVFDPQTSGGLLVFVDGSTEAEFLSSLGTDGQAPQLIGRTVASGTGPLVEVV